MRKFKVKSQTKIGVEYDVEFSDDGHIYCSCPAGSRGLDCNHKYLIKRFLNRHVAKLSELERIKEIYE